MKNPENDAKEHIRRDLNDSEDQEFKSSTAFEDAGAEDEDIGPVNETTPLLPEDDTERIPDKPMTNEDGEDFDYSDEERENE